MGYVHETILVICILFCLGRLAHWVFSNGWSWPRKLIVLGVITLFALSVWKGAFHGQLGGDQGFLPDAIATVGAFLIAQICFRRAGADQRWQAAVIGGFFAVMILFWWPLVRDGGFSFLSKESSPTTTTAPATAPSIAAPPPSLAPRPGHPAVHHHSLEVNCRALSYDGCRATPGCVCD